MVEGAAAKLVMDRRWAVLLENGMFERLDWWHLGLAWVDVDWSGLGLGVLSVDRIAEVQTGGTDPGVLAKDGEHLRIRTVRCDSGVSTPAQLVWTAMSRSAALRAQCWPLVTMAPPGTGHDRPWQTLGSPAMADSLVVDWLEEWVPPELAIHV